MVKSPGCKEVGLKKGPWKPEEDQKLLAYIEQHGHGSWRTLPAKAGLQRCGKSCRLRWTNYLRPDIRRGKFSLQEEQTIIQLHALLGNRWSAIAAQLSKRTDNEIKNYWNTHLKKRLTKMGIDPMTHKPKTNALLLGRTQDHIANLNHIAQWESARVEAEARLVKESKLLSSKYPHLHHHRHRHHPSTTAVPFPASKQPMTTMLPCLDILKAWQGAWTNNNNHYINNNVGTLESPTSVLQNNVLIAGGATVTATAIATTSAAADSTAGLDNSVFLTTAMKAKENYSDPQKNAIANWECSEEGNNDHEVDDVMQLLHGINDGSFLVDAPPCIPAGTSQQLLPSFPEGVVVTAEDDDLLLDGIFSSITGLYVDSCSGGNLEDNKKYWKY